MTIRCTEAEKAFFADVVKQLQTQLANKRAMFDRMEREVTLAAARFGKPPVVVNDILQEAQKAIASFDTELRFCERIAATLTTESVPTSETGTMTAARVEQLAERCNLGTFARVDVRPLVEGGMLIRISDDIPDSETGDQHTTQHGRWLYVSSHATASEVVQTIWLAVQLFEAHELREAFTFDGVAIFHPHHNVHSLVRFVSETPRDARKPMEASAS
jgi:hypothetical protein